MTEKLLIFGGSSVLVDPEDYSKVSRVKWQLDTSGNVIGYGFKNHKRTKLQLGKVVLGITYSEHDIVYLDGNKRNNCKGNLKIQYKNQVKPPKEVKNVKFDNKTRQWSVKVYYQDSFRRFGKYPTKELALLVYDFVIRYIYGDREELYVPDKNPFEELPQSIQNMLTKKIRKLNKTLKVIKI